LPNLSETEYSKAPRHTRHDSAQGIHIDPGPYIGIVKNNTDPMRHGRLQVWIPELGGNQQSQEAWRTVMYCSPFYGVTSDENRPVRSQDATGNPHSYGFWATPPDLDIKVMCIFVNGDPAKGYWFGCIPEWPAMHMVPGLSAGTGSNTSPVPIVEWNDKGVSSPDANFHQNISAEHPVQAGIWRKQGLDNDKLRGPGTSSAYRESPSYVTGISTPGRPITEPKTSKERVKGRKGGHSIVLDDGDADGNNKILRFRSSAGNMILMNDTAGFIYIINAAGTAWVEMSANGAINIYGQNQINVKSKSDIQLDATNIKINASKTIDIMAGDAIKINGSAIDINAEKGDIKLTSAKDYHLTAKTTYITSSGCLLFKSGKSVDIKASCKINLNTNDVKAASKAAKATAPKGLPDKEPWSGHTGTANPIVNMAYAAANGVMSGLVGDYGAAASFSGQAVQAFGQLSNPVGPYKAGTGSSGGLSGQAADTGGASTQTQFDSMAYSLVSSLAAPTINMGTPSGTFGEINNNPGNVAYTGQDIAIGQSDGMAIFSIPDDGFYALAMALIACDPSNTLTLLQLIAVFRPASSTVNPVDYANKVAAISGLSSIIDITDPDTLRKLVIAVTYIENNNTFSWTYTNVENGCARAQNRTPVLAITSAPWTNTGNSGGSGFVNPTSLVSGISSLIGAVTQAVGSGGVVPTGGSNTVSVGTALGANTTTMSGSNFTTTVSGLPTPNTDGSQTITPGSTQPIIPGSSFGLNGLSGQQGYQYTFTDPSSTIIPGTTVSAASDVAANAASGAAPAYMQTALAQVGLNENSDNAAISAYLSEGGHGMDPATTPWCAAFVGSTLEQGGIAAPSGNVATSYLNWGNPVDTSNVQAGDVLVEASGLSAGKPGGHVGFATGEVNSAGQIQMLSGNHDDQVALGWVNPSDVSIRRSDGTPAGSGSSATGGGKGTPAGSKGTQAQSKC
jgi:uncharacterized protein (TIGR02594 family)